MNELIILGLLASGGFVACALWFILKVSFNHYYHYIYKKKHKKTK